MNLVRLTHNIFFEYKILLSTQTFSQKLPHNIHAGYFYATPVIVVSYEMLLSKA